MKTLWMRLTWLTLLALLAACDQISTVRAPYVNQKDSGNTGSATGGTTGGLTPSVTITANGQADHLTVSSGTAVTVAWSSRNAVSCTINAQAGPHGTPQPQSWGNGLQGSQLVTISSETIFEAVCESAGGELASAQVNIGITAESPTVLITANGKPGQLAITPGTNVQIDWASQNAAQCVVTAQAGRNGTPQIQSWGNRLNGTHTLSLSSETLFVATCQNSAGQTASSQVDVTVTPLAPSVALTANGKTGQVAVDAGSSVALEWRSQNATQCSLTAQAGPTGAPQIQSWGSTPSGSHSLAISSETIFVETCQNSVGQSASASVDVTIVSPSPSVTLTANGKTGQISVTSGSTVQIGWSSQNAIQCSIAAGGQAQSWGNALSGSHSLALTTETLFVATCQNSAGQTATSQVDVAVTVPPPAPTVTLTANGQTGSIVVDSGSSVEIAWSSQNASQCSVAAGGQAQSWGTGLSGSHSVTLTTETAFVATCQNAEGATASSQVDVKVNAPPPAPTVAITANGIAGQLVVPYGSSVAIAWSSQNASQCSVAAGGQAQSWGNALSGSHALTVSSETVFVATCQNSVGVTTTAQVDVKVTAAAPLVTITANGKSDHLVVTSGNAVQIAWSSQNAVQCGITAQAGPQGTSQPQDWGNALSGTHSLVPTVETIFTATCQNAVGDTATSSVDVFVAPPCNGNGKTIIQLLTSQLVNNAPNQYMQYDLSYQDCNGQPAPIPSGQLWYDDAAYFQSGSSHRPYSVSTSDGTVNQSGNLKQVKGEDLFGNKGRDYFHFITDQVVQIPAGVTSLRVTIDMSNIEIHAYDTDTNNLPAVEKIETFLRIGDSQADVAPVMFQNR